MALHVILGLDLLSERIPGRNSEPGRKMLGRLHGIRRLEAESVLFRPSPASLNLGIIRGVSLLLLAALVLSLHANQVVQAQAPQLGAAKVQGHAMPRSWQPAESGQRILFEPLQPSRLAAFPSAQEVSGDDALLRSTRAAESQLETVDPLASMGPEPTSDRIPGAGHGADSRRQTTLPKVADPHAEVFADNCYPSASACAKCHEKIYNEWRISGHAYAAISPMFQKFEQKITILSQGTIGTFCVRCHAPVAVQAGFSRHESIVDAPYVYREGVTCVACHRVREAYGRVHGERRIEPGPLASAVYGSIGGDGVHQAVSNADAYKIRLGPDSKAPGQQIHLEGIRFEQLGDSGFCQSCHQVAVHPGIGLEVVWAQYRAGPACKKGISCQDCHMGLVPGKPQGYSYGAAANMSGFSVNNHRKHANHIFFGPGNSIAHPALFPHNEKALRWTSEQWLQFDWRSGWGTEEFEKSIRQGLIQVAFPPTWSESEERRDARKVIDENLELLALKKLTSVATMEAGLSIDGPFFDHQPRVGKSLSFRYRIENQSEGHNVPSGSLGAQPQLWLNVVLTGPDGRRLWESGYLDPNGDLANHHSPEVLAGRFPADTQLFNLQTQFLTTHVKGPDREMYLPINVDIDQLPFLRPGNIPVSVMNHPPFIRMEQKSIPPLGHKVAKYKIPGALLCEKGSYQLSVRMRSRVEPLYFMRFCDATVEMQQRMLEQTLDLHPYTVEFHVH